MRTPNVSVEISEIQTCLANAEELLEKAKNS
jgi:hypothetical protein